MLKEGQQIQLISLASNLDKSQVRNLEREDFHYWGMSVPDFLAHEERSPQSFNTNSVVEEARKSTHQTSQSVTEDVSPAEAMNQLNE